MLYAHGGVCGVVCMNIHACLCVHVHLCVPLCQHLLNGGYLSTSILNVCLITQVRTIEHSYSFAIACYFFCYMLQLTQCDVRCIYIAYIFSSIECRQLLCIQLSSQMSLVLVKLSINLCQEFA